jgi:hypothetical protein
MKKHCDGLKVRGGRRGRSRREEVRGRRRRGGRISVTKPQEKRIGFGVEIEKETHQDGTTELRRKQ